jgi:hypothetical protein
VVERKGLGLGGATPMWIASPEPTSFLRTRVCVLEVCVVVAVVEGKDMGLRCNTFNGPLHCSRLALSSRIQVCIMAVVMDTNEFSLTHCNAFTDWSVASPQTSSFRRNIQFLLYIYSLYLRFLCTYCRRKKRARSNITFFLQNYLWSAGYCV